MYLIKRDTLAASITAFSLFCETFGVTVDDLLDTERILPRLEAEAKYKL